MDEVLNLDISQFPEPIYSILHILQVKGALAAPQLFKTAMAWVWEQEKQFVPQYLIEEMNGMAAGICDSHVTPKSCNVTSWAEEIKHFNMLPELIRMACTAFGAWGKATGGNGLTQLRALDFGGGPFANYTVIQVNRNDPSSPAFVSVSFPGFVGVITGVSQSGIGISEKVWMTYDTPSLQPGSYDGEADVFVLRDILQFAKNRSALRCSARPLTFAELMRRRWWRRRSARGRSGSAWATTSPTNSTSWATSKTLRSPTTT